jgi:phosphoribosylformimino-5-aminoimidazole carboxamide ribotide isomerase
MRIIPAIDIIDGKCVRLTKGDYNTKKIYNENPLEVAKEFQDYGIQYLHLVDLDGAKSNTVVNHKILYQLASKTDLKIDFGGGIKNDKDIQIAFENGANQVTGGSVALKNKDLFISWLKRYGSEKIILGADAMNRKIMAQGWQEESEVDVVDFIGAYHKESIEYVVCTDISKDGMLEGCAYGLYEEILEKCPVKLIASGGVSSIDDLERLSILGCEGAIIGKAIYEGRILLSELREFAS